MKKYKLLGGLLLVVSILLSGVYAEYPTDYWRIGETGEMLQFSHGSVASPSSVLNVTSTGKAGINTEAPSSGESTLEFDVQGSLGADYYCDEDGLNCISAGAIESGIQTISSNASWPENPYDGQKVFNLDCRCMQTYDQSGGAFEPTYTRNMKYQDSDFPLILGEAGDVVFNTDGNRHCCYDGVLWENCDGSGLCGEIEVNNPGAFTFSCSTNPSPTEDFIRGAFSDRSLTIPIVPVTSGNAGNVVIEIEDGAFYAVQEVLLEEGQDEIIVYPLSYDGSGELGTQTFAISSDAGAGSCTGEAEIVTPPGEFEFECVDRSFWTPISFLSGTSNPAGFGSVPIHNAKTGWVKFQVNQNGFTATYDHFLLGGELEIILPFSFDGTPGSGLVSFDIISPEASGSCTGGANVVPITGGFAFDCVGPPIPTARSEFLFGTPSSAFLDFPITGASSGSVTVSINQNGFSTTQPLTVIGASGGNPGDTTLPLPVLSYDGTSGPGLIQFDVTSSEGTGTCTAQANVVATGFDFDCGTNPVSFTSFFTGETKVGAIPVTLLNVVQGPLNFTISQNGFTTTHTETVPENKASYEVVIPITFDGTGVAGTRTFQITSTEGNLSCTGEAVIADSSGGFDFDCGTNPVSPDIFEFGASSDGKITVPILNPTAGGVTLSIGGQGFTADFNDVLSGNETEIEMDITYDGIESIGNKTFGITSTQANAGSCTGEAAITNPRGSGDFNCVTPRPIRDTNFVTGVEGDGGLEVLLSNVSKGFVDFNINQNGFSVSHTEYVVDGQSGVYIPLVHFDGTQAPGTVNFAITSPDITGSCTGEAEVLSSQGDFAFNCNIGATGIDFNVGKSFSEVSCNPQQTSIYFEEHTGIAEGVMLRVCQDDWSSVDWSSELAFDFAMDASPVCTGGATLVAQGSAAHTGDGSSGSCGGSGTYQLGLCDKPGGLDLSSWAASAGAVTGAVCPVGTVEVTSGIEQGCHTNPVKLAFCQPEENLSQALGIGNFTFARTGSGQLYIPIIPGTNEAVSININNSNGVNTGIVPGIPLDHWVNVFSSDTSILVDPIQYDGLSGPGLVQFLVTSPQATNSCIGNIYVAEPDQCPAGMVAPSNTYPGSEFYLNPTELDDGISNTGEDSINSGNPLLVGRCTGDLLCDNGQLLVQNETCSACAPGIFASPQSRFYVYPAIDPITATETDLVSTDGDCTADLTCQADGSVVISNEVCNIECPEGTVLQNGVCVIGCDPGYVEQNGVCILECAPGYVEQNGVCIQDNCSFPPLITGGTSGFNYSVNTSMSAGESDKIYYGPRVGCTDYWLTVSCDINANGSSGESSMVDPFCDDGGGGGNYGCDGDTVGTAVDSYGHRRFTHNSENAYPKTIGTGGAKDNDNDFNNGNYSCEGAGDCKCTATFECSSINAGGWTKKGPEDCDPCYKNTGSSEEVPSRLYPDLKYGITESIGYVKTIATGTEDSTDGKVTCYGDANCTNGAPLVMSGETCSCKAGGDPKAYSKSKVGTQIEFESDVEFGSSGTASGTKSVSDGKGEESCSTAADCSSGAMSITGTDECTLSCNDPFVDDGNGSACICPDPEVEINDTCEIVGCMTSGAHNYDSSATYDSGDCETCSDGTMNGNEEDTDCGGSCTACEDTCSNGTMDGDEEDVDCGGTCGPCDPDPPYCGDGNVDAGESCEVTSDCSSGETCDSNCSCIPDGGGGSGSGTSVAPELVPRIYTLSGFINSLIQ